MNANIYQVTRPWLCSRRCLLKVSPILSLALSCSLAKNPPASTKNNAHTHTRPRQREKKRKNDAKKEPGIVLINQDYGLDNQPRVQIR